jgi:anthranilate synthase
MSSESARYITAGDVVVHRLVTEVRYDGALAGLKPALDRHRGALFACGSDVPGRYARSDVGFVDPPLEVTATGRRFCVRALNPRGEVLLPRIARALGDEPAVIELVSSSGVLTGAVPARDGAFSEEERTRQPSVFSVLRALVGVFASPVDDRLGLYGAFGYDLAFQLDAITMRRPRRPDQRDLVLYLPDALVVVDHRRGRAHRHEYEFIVDWASTAHLPRVAVPDEIPTAPAPPPPPRDHAPGEYAALVETADAAFRRGDLFEVVPSQSRFEPLTASPSEISARLAQRNPAPYSFHVNLGGGEHLVGASPEMFVRVTGDRVETAPIAGTIARGADALGDAEQVERLYASEKDAAELTMCTDVDRNDKSRVCVPGSVRVIGRRQIEVYSRLIHTVDHVEGRLSPGHDAIDAFTSHAWAVTVTGAPKLAAMQFIEDHERSPRGFYGGAVGVLGFDGRLDTGLTLRTLQIRGGIAEVRAGATLLHGSDPEAEERETELKASALLDAIERPTGVSARAEISRNVRRSGQGRRVLLVDHQDSFVHTLGNYLRQTGAVVVTLRAGFPAQRLADLAPDLVVLSPGPGRPVDFDLARTIGLALDQGAAIFGVCLGLQGLVEYFGGRLGVLPVPVHGRASVVRVRGGRLFAGLPREFRAGRYHSLHTRREDLPAVLESTAESDDGVVMAIEHVRLPIAAVQFHPESIMTAHDEIGLRLLENALDVGRSLDRAAG